MAKPYIKGLTTNLGLTKKAGIKNQKAFAKDVLQAVTAKLISLEVFTGEIAEIKRQALLITFWGESCLPLIKVLGLQGVKLYVTALLALAQVRGLAEDLNLAFPAFVSVLAGRIADTVKMFVADSASAGFKL